MNKKENQDNLSINQANGLIFPLDKVNSTKVGIWNLDEATEDTLAFKVGEKHNKTISIFVDLDFDKINQEGVNLSRPLDDKDKRLYLAIASLFAEGNEIVTARQIYLAMGNQGAMCSETLRDIEKRVSKLMFTKITIDNMQEIAAGYKYAEFSYKGSLLPVEQVSVSVRGRLTDVAFRLFREPPLVSFAKERKQFAEVPLDVLKSLPSQTEKHLRIEHYLIERILHMKHDKKFSRKILWESLYNDCRLLSEDSQNLRADKKRIKQTTKQYLEHYSNCQSRFIASYEEDDDGVIIILKKSKKA